MESPVEELEKTWELCQQIDFAPSKETFESGLLEPTANLLGAEASTFRVFSRGNERPTTIIGLGINDSVHEAYLDRYYKLDPTSRLLRRHFAKPIFNDRNRPGLWSDEHTAASENTGQKVSQDYSLAYSLQDFQQFKKQFLLPNRFFHYLSIRFQDTSGKYTFALDYNRPEKSCPFGRLEFARAKVVTMMFHARAIQLSSAINFHDTSSDITTEHAVKLKNSEQWPGSGNEHNGNAASQQLSTRELEVAQNVALGLTNKEVSDVLGISVRTVENHIRSIFEKLDVNTRTRLAAKLHDVRAMP